jgi:hypothetical protein
MMEITQSGVKCPECKEEIYSEDKHEKTECECGLTYVIGALDYLGYRTGAPWDVSDVEVVVRTSFVEEEEEEEIIEPVIELAEIDAELGTYLEEGPEEDLTAGISDSIDEVNGHDTTN